MMGINEAWAAWSRVYARLVQAELKWAEVAVSGDDAERSELESQLQALQGQSDALLQQASQVLTQVAPQASQARA